MIVRSAVLLILTASFLAVSSQATASTRTLWVTSTAYCEVGHTASGISTHYGSIAVDPRTIKMGSKIYVPGYGWGRAEDTGGAIIRYRIDIWFSSCREAIIWGVRRVRIRIVDPR